MQKETQTLGHEYWKEIYSDIQKEFNKGVEKKSHTVKGSSEHNRSRRKLIPKSIEVTTERNQSTVTATLSIKLELTQELTPKQIENILTTHLKRI